ncbi:hypothetical protein F66182_4497 [Fusarium sp. NRRL 66182]|nr:hypothetical protein F66182_4497 [Fusarium sp. NRRL 66182]
MDIPRNSIRDLSAKFLTYLGFAILGLVHVAVPFIVHSANYLIIPYPRWIVVLVETLPAFVTKLVMPHVLHRIPYWIRPLAVGAGWIIVTLITKVTPPNIAPPLRILTSAIASASAAAMEVSFLGMIRYYGRAGLAGWGAGVGAGAVFCAVLPFVLTIWFESFLRDFIDCICVLTGAMLVAFFVILPGAPVNYPDARYEHSKVDAEDALALVMLDPVQQLSRVLSYRNRIHLAETMVQPFMLPLFTAFVAQALAYPGISRALPLPASFGSFFSYLTTYSLAFQTGNVISRTFTLLFRTTSTKVAFMALYAATFILLTNALFLVFPAQVLMRLLAFCAGLSGGAIYMIIVDRLIEETPFELGINQEFSLQVVGVDSYTLPSISSAAVSSRCVTELALQVVMKRRTHNKSRHGCRNCKKRHVKCDEQGPPCTNCAARNLESCSYLPDPPAQLPATEIRRRIELELMHRWSTSTYKSLASIPEDEQWLQEDMAHWALRHEYLLHGMFAFSALEVALCGGAVVVEEESETYYAKLALEYYDKASRSFRAQLENVTSENAQKMFMFSFLAVSVNMALGQCSAFEGLDQGILERMVTLWELLMGNASLADRHFEALISGALSRSTEALMLRTQQQTETPTSLSKETEIALERLSTIVHKASEVSPSDEANMRIRSYRASVSAIQTCFEQDSRDVLKGMPIAFPALAGRDFGILLKGSDPVALLLMMHWGVQLHTLGKLAWWVGTFGKKMVDEVSRLLWPPEPESDVMLMPEWRDGIIWARMEVELEALADTTLDVSPLVAGSSIMM